MFWKLTPREFAAVLEGQHRRELRQFSADVAAAHIAEQFARSKKLPDLDKVLRKINGQPAVTVEKTPDELLKIMRAWIKNTGGEDHTAHLDLKGLD